MRTMYRNKELGLRARGSLVVAFLGLVLIFGPLPGIDEHAGLVFLRVGLGAILAVGGIGKALYDTFF